MLDRRRLHGNVNALVSADLESEGFLVAFTERESGTSPGPFRSLNLGLRTGDTPDAVAANRARVCEALGIETFACARQVHGAHVERVTKAQRGCGFSDPATSYRNTDALITSTSGAAVAILTADCFPIALVDPKGRTIAAVHAGWRGVASGIVGKAVGAFDDASELQVVIGPGIGVDHYEVGGDVVAAVSSTVDGGAVTRTSNGRVFLDLGATIERALRACGVRRIESAGVCTACEEDRFFSYRRDGVTGRQALIAERRV